MTARAAEPSNDATANDAMPDLMQMFREVMGRFPAAVSIITARGADRPAAMTATAVCSFSASPPSLLCSVAEAALSHPVLSCCDAFAVNLLHVGQAETARAFARSDNAKFARSEWVDGGPQSVPIIRGCAASFLCEPAARFHHYDHSILIGRVIAAELGSEQAALVYSEQTFWRLAA